MEISYQTGFGNHFSTEARPGTLPLGQNSPRQSPGNLYPEQISGTAFTRPRSENQKSWLYRTAPSVLQKPFQPYKKGGWSSVTDRVGEPLNPTAQRWGAPQKSAAPVDFIDSIQNLVAPREHPGCAVHQYFFCDNPPHRFFQNNDGEMLILPEKGALLILTELGRLQIQPRELAVIPRGIKFQVQGLATDSETESWFRGYIGENTGEPYRLPELGPLGANGLANPRDFQYPVAWCQGTLGNFLIVTKFENHFWQTETSYHPCNVVAWHGNYAPYKYDLNLFNTMGSVSYDHPDPSIYTVLTSPSSVTGRASSDFVVFPPRWLVAEKTFRPPYFHKNRMSEFMGLIDGVYDAKEGGGFVPGGCSLHNCMTPHGPDASTFNKGVSESDEPRKVLNTMAFMFEGEKVFYPSKSLSNSGREDLDYSSCWASLVPVEWEG